MQGLLVGRYVRPVQVAEPRRNVGTGTARWPQVSPVAASISCGVDCPAIYPSMLANSICGEFGCTRAGGGDSALTAHEGGIVDQTVESADYVIEIATDPQIFLNERQHRELRRVTFEWFVSKNLNKLEGTLNGLAR